MSDEQKNKPVAEQIRDTAKNGHDTLLKMLKEIDYPGTPAIQELITVARIGKVLCMSVLWQGAVMSEIAAQLAERNTRDTAAEMQMRHLGGLVDALQAAAAAQGVIVPGMPGFDPKKMPRR